jgi:long-chain acyl-CoA synthetase
MQTIVDLIEESCRKFTDKTALRQKIGDVWQNFSYSTLSTTSDRVAAGLLRNGFKAGDHAALLAPSSPRWVIAYVGILKAGGIVIPIDKELKSIELRHILSDCQARVLFTDSPYLYTVLEIINFLPALFHVVTLNQLTQLVSFGKPPATALDGLISEWHNQNATDSKRCASIENLAGHVDRLLREEASPASGTIESNSQCSQPPTNITSFEKNGKLLTFEMLLSDTPFSLVPCSPHDTAVILYTSGTTGRAKGAMLSHFNIVSNIWGATSHFSLDESIHTLSFLPISHVFEQVCGILLPLSLGGTVSFCESLKKLAEKLAEVKPTFFLGVPAIFRMILDRVMKNIASRRLSRVLFSFSTTRPLVTAKIRQTFGSGTIFISGGAALDPAISAGLEKMGLTIFQGYGITETSPIISAECPEWKRSGTVGRILPNIEVKIDSPNEEMVGEILVKGPNVMQGYFGNPQATDEVLMHGWYRTGDLGRLDKDGFLSICSRVKNLIVTPNGKNVYPEEVENELLKSRYIAEVMVYGHKVTPASEEIHAKIYPDQEALVDYGSKLGKSQMTAADVESLIRTEVFAACERLAVYKRIRRFTIREDEFPKTTTRKIKRFEVEASNSSVVL